MCMGTGDTHDQERETVRGERDIERERERKRDLEREKERA